LLIVKSFRFRVYPDAAQIARLGRWDNALRFLWNLALEQRLSGYARPRDERIYPSAFDQINELTELRAALPWLADVPRGVSAQILIELDRAWQLCFKKLVRAPHFKRKGRDTFSFYEPYHKKWRLDGSTIRFPKLGNLRAVVHRSIDGKPKTCALRCEAGQWFASLAYEVDVADPTPRDVPVVAIDRGVVNLVGDSDGRLEPSRDFYGRAMKRLAHAQRAVSRKRKGSKNREKAKLRVARLHRKVRRQREHFLHVLSAGYAKSHGTVVVEKLNIVGMTRSASGTEEATGSNVAQKSGLNRGILNAAWGKFGRMLSYKLAWSGGHLEEEVAAFSSQTCSACGHVDAASRASQAVFRCTSCGHTEHADLNAPKVLKQRYEARANRSGKPVEATGSKSGLRSRKRVRLRVPRRSPESLSFEVVG
jgi:putative transposase